MSFARAGRVVIATCSIIGLTAVAVAAPHRSPEESAIVACHETILEASRRLTAALEGHLGRCITHGIDCLTAAGDLGSCCARAAGRCGDDQEAIADGEREFDALLTRRSCTRVPFAQLLAADGLGFGDLAARCACASPPIPVTTLGDLAACLRRLVADDVVQRLALVEAPRAGEALVCLGLDAEFPAALAGRPSLCETCPAASASPTPTAGPTAAVATASPTAAPTLTGAATPPATFTAAPTATPAATFTAVPTATATPAATFTAPPTATATVTVAPTATAAATATPVATTTVITTPLTFPSATPTQTEAPPPSPTPAPTPVSVCGNGILEGDEECDGSAIDDTGCLEDVCTCDDFCEDAGGTLSCNANCTVNFSACTAGGCAF